ncbi:Bug family tripartite tricarboxylate transporter substrate binding protein [Azohydromonas lata]|uniref:Tripartite tricarboxylate transporter substrate binding protein n=1 Tax=Azohydromonas lata TaxID=45677 RepID=A0ABU5INQ1_9BURK|nr:tripartite tricarboxylate transporter substrate binding protein [Azohydromonas lata]MDZ5460528.1 tripartite tricarboxylate transporter substrate binding protein [Azohydromonas lata]
MNRFFASMLLVVASVLAANAAAQARFPSKTIGIVVPTTPGGGSDQIARLIAAKLTEQAAWTVTVVNRPGASGTLALGEVAGLKSDGHELVIGLGSNMTFAPALMKLSFDPVGDLVPVAFLADSPLVALVAETSPYKTWKEFVDAACRSVRRFTYGTTGNGTSPHVTAERLRLDHGVRIVHVPYKGSPLAMSDLAGGHIDMTFASLGAALPLLRSGKLRALAITTAERSSALASVPTFAELGYANFEQPEWYGLFAPRGIPSAIADEINAEVNNVLALPKVRTAALAQGYQTRPESRRAFSKMVQADVRASKAVVLRAGIKID